MTTQFQSRLPAPVLNDRRRDRQTQPWGYVVFTDTCLSGWGLAPGRSLYVLAVDSPSEADIVMANGRARSDMKRPRLVDSLPRARRGDHISIADRHCARPWYVEGGFE